MRLVPAAGPRSPGDDVLFLTLGAVACAQGVNPFLLPCFSGVLLLTSLAPLTRRDAPEVSFFLFSRGICGVGGQLEMPVSGPAPSVQVTEEKLESDPRCCL